VPEPSFDRTRHHIFLAGSVAMERPEDATTWLTMGEANVSASSITIVKLAAPGTSVQSKATVRPAVRRASFPGERSDGAGSGPAAGETPRDAVRVAPAAAAETVADVGEATGLVVTVNPAEEAPAGTATLEGTAATEGFELARRSRFHRIENGVGSPR